MIKTKLLTAILLVVCFSIGNAQTATNIVVLDTRNINSPPSDYSREARFEFKERSVIGVPGIGGYSGLLTIAPWIPDNTGNKHHQLNFNDGGIYYRTALSGNYSWDSWRKILIENEDGNVGIGTENPGVKLDVNGTTSFGKTYHNVLKVGALESSPAYFYIDTKIPFNDSPAPQLHITGYNYSNANKAIKLTISWYVYNNKFYWSQYKSDLGYYNPTSIKLGTYDDAGTIRVRIEIANDGTYWSSYFISATDINGSSSNYAGWSSTLGTMPATTGNIISVTEYAGIIYNNAGNMLIGKNTQDNKTYKLDVAGKIRADEIVVNTTGADFVFEKDYKLPSIEHVANYVQENKHLPDIPSANEMVKNGVSMGELQVKLLQKVEELTLYAIQQNNSKKELEGKLAKQENQYNALLEKVEMLTKQIENK